MPRPSPQKSPHEAYIENSPEFAQPILRKIQKVIRKACPEVEESLKWSSPHFGYKGMLAGMTAFKAHVNFGFWKAKQMEDPEGLFEIMGKTQAGMMRIERLSDLPSERVLAKYVKEAMQINEAAASKARKKTSTRKKTAKKKVTRSIEAPEDLLKALKRKKQALATYDGFSYSAKKEYVEWITEAKRETTREKRVTQAVEWMAEGKPRNWKYMKEWR